MTITEEHLSYQLYLKALARERKKVTYPKKRSNKSDKNNKGAKNNGRKQKRQ